MGESSGVAMEVQKQMASKQIEYLNNFVQSSRQQSDAGALAPVATPGQIAHQEKVQRTVYVGNLAQGVITQDTLEEFFNQALSHLVPDAIATPPVNQVKMEGSTGRFAFVEFLTEDIATQALRMDQMVEIYGRIMNVGRPKAYIEGYDSSKIKVALSEDDNLSRLLPSAPNPVLSQATRYILLSNILPAGELSLIHI